MTRKELDDAFPTVVRYGGFILTFVLVGASIAGYGLQLAAGYVAATGMILYKSVRNASQANGDDDNGDDKKEKNGDRWSHLP